MKAFDTDVLTEIFAGNAAFVKRAAAIPIAERKVPIIVLEEILRGRLHAIRQVEARKSKISIELAYAYLAETIEAFRPVPLLAYSAEAESLFQQWRREKVRGSEPPPKLPPSRPRSREDPTSVCHSEIEARAAGRSGHPGRESLSEGMIVRDDRDG